MPSSVFVNTASPLPPSPPASPPSFKSAIKKVQMATAVTSPRIAAQVLSIADDSDDADDDDGVVAVVVNARVTSLTDSEAQAHASLTAISKADQGAQATGEGASTCDKATDAGAGADGLGGGSISRRNSFAISDENVTNWFGHGPVDDPIESGSPPEPRTSNGVQAPTWLASLLWQLALIAASWSPLKVSSRMIAVRTLCCACTCTWACNGQYSSSGSTPPATLEAVAALPTQAVAAPTKVEALPSKAVAVAIDPPGGSTMAADSDGLKRAPSFSRPPLVHAAEAARSDELRRAQSFQRSPLVPADEAARSDELRRAQSFQRSPLVHAAEAARSDGLRRAQSFQRSPLVPADEARHLPSIPGMNGERARKTSIPDGMPPILSPVGHETLSLGSDSMPARDAKSLANAKPFLPSENSISEMTKPFLPSEISISENSISEMTKPFLPSKISISENSILEMTPASHRSATTSDTDAHCSANSNNTSAKNGACASTSAQDYAYYSTKSNTPERSRAARARAAEHAAAALVAIDPGGRGNLMQQIQEAAEPAAVEASTDSAEGMPPPVSTLGAEIYLQSYRAMSRAEADLRI
jgi:hypothetical protein